MRGEGPRSSLRSANSGAAQLTAGEAQARLVDVDARDFERCRGRPRARGCSMLGGVARGHVGDGAQADRLHVLREARREIILELLERP